MMDDGEFEKLVHEGYLAIPEQFRKKIKNVVIKIEDEPSEEVRDEMNIPEGESLLGLYTGLPLSERGSNYGVGITYPDTIYIYKLPTLEEAQNDPDRVKQVVADTIWHEFAHYFGMNEDEVEERERQREERSGE